LAGSGRLDAYRRLGRVSVVDADGNQTVLTKDHSKEIIVALLIGGVIWFLLRD
jgi:hypothetical protein